MSSKPSTHLLSTRRFAPLFWCQLFSALNDNLLKNALVVLILYRLGGEGAGTLVPLAGAVLMAPFVLLSALGGQIADRFDKASVARRLKLAEIPVAAFGALGLVLHSVPMLFLTLALFGVIASLFGPIKYGLLPEQLSGGDLPAGNAWVEGATFLAILVGTMAGGLVSQDFGPLLLAGALVAISGMSWLAARLIPSNGPAAPQITIERNVLASTMHLVGELHSERRLWIGGLITGWFWFVGAVALTLLPLIVKQVVGAVPELITVGLAVFTIGIALGSMTAARWSPERPNLALVPVGALGMALFSFDLALTTRGMVAAVESIGVLQFVSTFGGVRTLIDLFGLAFAGGLFIVPSFAAVQAWAPVDRRARVVAACNILSAVFILVSALAVMVLELLGASIPMVLALLGVANLVVLALVLRAWGREGVKDLARFIFGVALDLEVKGLENLPKAGERAIIAPNHVSLLDAGIMHSILPDHAVFAIDTGMAQKSWVKPFLNLVRTESIDPTKPLGTRHLVNLVKGGETLVIFPEGRLTVTGGLMKVYDGTAMIADKADAVVVPVRIDGPERSPFGYLSKSQTRKALFPKTTVTVLPPVKLAVDATLKGKPRRQKAGAQLQDIMVESAVRTAPLDMTLFDAVTLACRTRDTGKPILSDPVSPSLSYRKAILAAQVLGRKIATLAEEGKAVGLMLPSSVGAVVTFLALQTIGRVPAMINFTAGARNVEGACTAADIKVVLTSRVFVEKARLQELIKSISNYAHVVYLEDVRAEVKFSDKVAALLLGDRAQSARRPDDPAVILFTSGSEGTPKGVVLSHRNILANAMQCLMRIAVNGDDKVFNVLPMFHSFGLTGGVIMPLLGGIPAYLYPSPLHYRIVPELVYGTNATIMFGTDTFLAGYARSAHPYDLARVRLIVAGAEPVKDRTRATYMEKFGVRILEGYGVTETAPVLALNTPLANRSGTVGRLAPLMKARLEPVPGIEEGGRLYVSGPNVMLGYLRAENPGVLEPPVDGWHDTGDIVSIDGDGFIRILGRAKRFAKIGGEMVSLTAAKLLASETWPEVMTMVVTVPDARKGERLVLMTTVASHTRDQLLAKARAKGVPELMVPAEIMHVAALPLLGSGKPDYVTATKLAREKAVATPAAPVAAE